MNNDWAQLNHANGNVTLFNTNTVAYLLKHTAGTRKLGFSNGDDPVILEPGDTLLNKTQAEVETFLGGPFVKMVLDQTTLFVPVKSLVSIHKVGAVITVTMSQNFIESTGVITPVDETAIEGEFG